MIKRTNKQGTANGTGAYWNWYTNASGYPQFSCSDGTNTTLAQWATAHPINKWVHMAAVRRGATLELYIDGVLRSTVATTVGDLTNTSAVLQIGSCYYNGTINPSNASLAMIKISATAPSANQLGQIYRDELQIFRAGAQCTIDGTQNTVGAVGYDDITDSVHVGTSWGRSTFRGLQRVESAATSVAGITSISAAAGSHITAGASGARFGQPAMTLRSELKMVADARRNSNLTQVPYWFTGDGVSSSFIVPAGIVPRAVYQQGMLMRPDGHDYVETFDGYAYTITFNSSIPLNHNVCVMGVKNV
jgi:hypothetical protein